jgi:hypothetical protein
LLTLFEIEQLSSLTLFHVSTLRLIGTVNIVVDKHRVDRSRVRLAEVEIGDETGTVSLRARDEQIDILQEVSERSGAVVLRNCTLELYQGKHIRLAVTKWGKLSMYPDDVASTPPPPSKMNKDRNFSLIDLSIVASEMVDIQSEGTHNSSKQSKGSSESIDTGARHVSWKIGGKTNSKQQSQSLKNRNSRDRRQSRGKSGGATPPHYGGPSSERGMIQSQLGKMRFHGHNYPRYEQSFPYVNSSQQDVLSPASAQHLLLHHQYELQHRQFHQMYTQGQQDRIHSNIQPPGMILQSTTPPGGFEYNSIGSDQHPSVIPMVGSNPILMPVGMAGTSVQPRMPPIASTLPHHDHYGSHLAGIPSSLTTCGKDGDNSVMHTQTPPIPRMEQTMQYMSVSPDDSQFSAGKMNPDAIAFAPAYMTPQGKKRFPPSNALHYLHYFSLYSIHEKIILSHFSRNTSNTNPILFSRLQLFPIKQYWRRLHFFFSSCQL